MPTSVPAPPAAGRPPSIVVDGLRVRYRGSSRYAVDGVSFTAAAGEILGLLGPNGAGKSTTARVLTRLLREHEGRADVLGRPVRDWNADLYRRIGVSFELPAHFARLTARENLQAVAGLYGTATEPAGPLLDRVGLGVAADQPVVGFSKGMQLRLNLARALIHRPEVLFLDEPTSGLDPVHAHLVRDLIREQAEQGRTVLLTTHDMTTAENVCDRVAFIVDGRVVAVDTPRGHRLRYGRPTVVVEYRTGDRLARREFELSTLGTDPDFGELLRGGRIETMHTREASFEQVFIAVTSGGPAA
ncbi:fluoroquinolone transport system ATP-binding protein [Micromonospora sp. Llam0]|uniref:ABC transporter ATP-binding protein n=1 Tax=Micromonospora sp. Llam0 TaxID=2485143 RepID=UPI000FB01657|nr:ABC transporter ATP-binding protein [Micromonospora sp. Llam0]ROO50881.1 fluoroquinolone transport system ATP-binding protein [Micromonospora sp. Llam0]